MGTFIISRHTIMRNKGSRGERRFAEVTRKTKGTGLAARLKKTVVLVGMMGAGKTAVGKALALRLGAPFKDSDAEIETAANASIAEIFEKYGEDFFRDKEAQVIERLLRGMPAVLSTGGGAFLRSQNRDVISEVGLSVHLDAPLDLLWDRVKHKDTRPLLRTPDPRATLSQLYAARQPDYARADISVPAEAGLSIEEMAARVEDAILARADVLEPLG